MDYRKATTAELKAELKRLKRKKNRSGKEQKAVGRIEVQLLRRGESETKRYKVWHGPWSGKVKHWRGRE